MKISVLFKTPDAVHYALEDSGLNDEQRERAEDFINDFVQYGESVKICFDLDAKTATVVKN